MASLSGHLDNSAEASSSLQDNSNNFPTSSSAASRGQPKGEDGDDDQNDSVAHYYKTLQWLEAEVKQYKIQVNVMKDAETAERSGDDSTAAERVENLQSQLMDLSTKQNVVKSMIHLVQLGQTLLSLLFPENGETNAKLQTSAIELVERSTSSVSDILRIHKEVQTSQSTLTGLKEDCLVLRQENRELMNRLQQLKDAKAKRMVACEDDEQINRVRTDCDHLTSKLELATGCLQGFIHGSGVDWARDELLRDLVLRIGQPVEDLLQGLTIQSKKP